MRKTMNKTINKTINKAIKAFSFIILLSITNIATAAHADDFVIRIKSDNPGGPPTQFIISTAGSSGLAFNYNVDCDDDGTYEAMAQTGDYICDYFISGAGIYTIRIQDNSGSGTGYPRPHFFNYPKLLSVEQWGTGMWASMFISFGISNVVFNTTDIPNFSNVSTFRRMFESSTSANLDTSNWDTSSVTDMNEMFRSATSANPDTSNWDTSSVTDMERMFIGATSANPDTSNWNTSSVTNMRSMFSGATSANPDVSNWDTSSVISMRSMFSGATSANPDTSNWDTSSVTDMNSMFEGATSASPIISNWDVSSVTDMTEMFLGIALPTTEYDAALINFSTQNLKSNVVFDAGNSQFCSTAAIAARDSIISFNNWTITDGGLCDQTIFANGFESPVVTFKSAQINLTLDFSLMTPMQESEPPKLIAEGLNADKQTRIKIHMRRVGENLQYIQSYLDETNSHEQIWIRGLWKDVDEDKTEIGLW